MREIKFCLFSQETNKVIYPDDRGWFNKAFVGKNGVLQDIRIDVALKRTDKVKVMQYTGLKDKNGKEIYEGDILKVTTVRGDIRWKMEVDFEDGCFSLKEGPELWKLKYDYPNHEVIGNIYENPELLEESK